MNAVGTIEILVSRVYPLDAEATNDTRTEVLVEPGTYEVFRDGMTTFWMMRGRLNRRGVQRMGDGMFGVYTSDGPTETEVVFSSRRYGPDEWAELLAHECCREGHPSQRLRVRMFQQDAEVSA